MKVDPLPVMPLGKRNRWWRVDVMRGVISAKGLLGDGDPLGGGDPERKGLEGLRSGGRWVVTRHPIRLLCTALRRGMGGGLLWNASISIPSPAGRTYDSGMWLAWTRYPFGPSEDGDRAVRFDPV